MYVFWHRYSYKLRTLFVLLIIAAIWVRLISYLVDTSGLVRKTTTQSTNGTQIIDDIIKHVTKTGLHAKAIGNRQAVCVDCKQNFSLMEIRENVSSWLDLESILATYRDDVKVSQMTFHQNQWPMGETVPPNLRDEYENNFYSLERQKSCALVGDKIHLLRGCGHAIDDHDFVMRVNVLKGFESEIGWKTNLTVINPNTVKYYNNKLTKVISNSQNTTDGSSLQEFELMGSSTVWLPYTLTSDVKRNLTFFLTETKDKRKLPFRIAYAPVPISHETLNRIWNATLGDAFITFTMATLLCDSVDVYGFVPRNREAGNSPIQLSNATLLYLKHKLAEVKLFQAMEEAGAIRLLENNC
ncbi:CMP-N-acetylneuraminate-poly-alpha-2,8-sialyltransferase-like [Saccoglossus kowalevskii]